MRGLLFFFAIACFVGVVLAARASRRLLVLRVRDGRVVSARGRAPGELLHDFQDVTERAKSSGEIVILIENGSAVIQASTGIDHDVVQRLRNVVGRFSLARLRAAPRVANR